jgi:hypothetical protein
MRKIVLAVMVGAAVGLVLSLSQRPRTKRVETTEDDSTGGGALIPGAPPASRDPVAAIRDGVGKEQPLPPRLNGAKVPNNQNERGYDPVRLAEQVGGTSYTIFRSEVRDRAWATEREAAILPLVERDLKTAGVQAQVTTECRYLSCVLTVVASNMTDLRQANRAMQFALLGSSYEPSPFTENPDGTGSFRATIAFEAQDRDPKTWENSYREKRRQRLSLLRQEKRPPDYPPIPEE